MAAPTRTRTSAFDFGSWLSPEFKLYLIKEFQRLKDEENDRLHLGWNLQRTLAKSTTVGEEEIDLQETHEKLIAVEAKIREATVTHNAFLKELGLPPLPGDGVENE